MLRIHAKILKKMKTLPRMPKGEATSAEGCVVDVRFAYIAKGCHGNGAGQGVFEIRRRQSSSFRLGDEALPEHLQNKHGENGCTCKHKHEHPAQTVIFINMK